MMGDVGTGGGVGLICGSVLVVIGFTDDFAVVEVVVVVAGVVFVVNVPSCVSMVVDCVETVVVGCTHSFAARERASDVNTMLPKSAPNCLHHTESHLALETSVDAGTSTKTWAFVYRCPKTNPLRGGPVATPFTALQNRAVPPLALGLGVVP